MPINNSDFDQNDDQIAAAMEHYRCAISQVVSEMLPGSVSRLELDDPADGQSARAIVTIPLDMGDLRVSISERPLRARPFADLGGLLALRIGEAIARGSRFQARLGDATARVEATIARTGSLIRLVSLEMDAEPITEEFDWQGRRLEARLEMLDTMLQPTVEHLRCYSAREFGDTIRSLAKKQLRLVERRSHLAENDAVLELSPAAEQAISEHRLTVGAVASELLKPGSPSEKRAAIMHFCQIGVSICEGRLLALHEVGAPSVQHLDLRYLKTDELRAA